MYVYYEIIHVLFRRRKIEKKQETQWKTHKKRKESETKRPKNTEENNSTYLALHLIWSALVISSTFNVMSIEQGLSGISYLLRRFQVANNRTQLRSLRSIVAGPSRHVRQTPYSAFGKVLELPRQVFSCVTSFVYFLVFSFSFLFLCFFSFYFQLSFSIHKYF